MNTPTNTPPSKDRPTVGEVKAERHLADEPKAIMRGVEDEAAATLSEQPRIKLQNLRYAVIGNEQVEQGERGWQRGRSMGMLKREIRNVDTVLHHDLGLDPYENMAIRSPNTERAMKLFNDIVRDGIAPDVDLIFVEAKQKTFVDAFEQWLAANQAAQTKYGNVKIILYGEKEKEEEESVAAQTAHNQSPRIIGTVVLPARFHVPFGVAVAGILANKGVVELPPQYADIPLKIRADEFNREAQKLLLAESAKKPDVKMWDNPELLSGLCALVNKYRAEQKLPAVALKTEGPNYFVWLGSEFYMHSKSAYISAEDLFLAANDYRTM